MRQLWQYLRNWAILSLLCLVLGWSLPAQAANRPNPELEQQVLQILRQHPETIIESLQAYQQQQQQQINQARAAFFNDLKTHPQIAIADSPILGITPAKNLIVEFSDFQCPYCAEAHKKLNQLLAKHQNDVTLVYKHLPLIPVHAEAMPAARASWAANQQGKFWEYHDALFTNQKRLGEDLYLEIAKKLQLDMDKFNSDRLLADTTISKDIQLAQSLGVDGTPFFVMNNQNFSGALQVTEIAGKLAS
ncbi:DsbA family protein [Nostoc sp. TCL26-01]|uniref:DsbA family protein n=1 Tax=Nostoc sp. TCL26-01 TaxID=2576904 RepID=UPI0015BEC9B9|nr:DsbA family protein [Nostoc sp. TCL26-01]QLE59570.1 DsbA family protein [Nostoc sp. TCL26-01]